MEVGIKAKGPLRKGRCELNPEQPGGSQVKPGQAETTWHVQRPWGGNTPAVFKGQNENPCGQRTGQVSFVLSVEYKPMTLGSSWWHWTWKPWGRGMRNAVQILFLEFRARRRQDPRVAGRIQGDTSWECFRVVANRSL